MPTDTHSFSLPNDSILLWSLRLRLAGSLCCCASSSAIIIGPGSAARRQTVAAENSIIRIFGFDDGWGFFFTEFRFSHWSKREEVRGNEKKKLIIPKSRRWTKSPLIVAAAAAASLKVFSIDQKLLFDSIQFVRASSLSPRSHRACVIE